MSNPQFQIDQLKQHKCQICSKIMKSDYKVCAKHWTCGWLSTHKVDVEGKGKISSDDVKIGDKVLTFKGGDYVEVAKIWKAIHMDTCELNSPKIVYSTGLIISHGYKMKTCTLNPRSVRPAGLSVINFVLKEVKTITLYDRTGDPLYVKTY